MDWSPEGFRADFVPSQPRAVAAAREIGNLLARWAAQAQEFAARTSSRARGILAACVEAAAPSADLRPATERLEGRTLLASVWLSNGTLYLAGDTNTGNSLTVDLQSNGGYWANVNGKTLSTAPGAVRSI